MADVGVTPASGRKKSLNAELNLVPFIDLLSMCICFLLMTAVWMEIGSVNVKQSVGTDAPAANNSTYEMDVKYINPQQMEIQLKRPGTKGQSLTVQGADINARVAQIKTILQGLAPLAPVKAPATKLDLGQAITVARVTTKAGVPYGEIVSIMDVLRDVGIVNLGMVPVKE